MEDNKFELEVRCINPQNSGLKTDKIYKVTESQYFHGCYVIDLGYNCIVAKDMFEVVSNDL